MGQVAARCHAVALTVASLIGLLLTGIGVAVVSGGAVGTGTSGA